MTLMVTRGGGGGGGGGGGDGLTELLLAVHALVLRLVFRPPQSSLLQTPATKVLNAATISF